jgi:hypothetical protein
LALEKERDERIIEAVNKQAEVILKAVSETEGGQ